MTDVAIRVENISKQYRIGQRQERYTTLRDTIVKNLSTPFRRLWSVIHGQSSSVSSEKIWALKKVSFDIKQGEIVGIIGRNGAGKSTLLKILSQITEPTEGHAEIYGRIGSLLEIGTGFHPELTGKENIFLNGAILGMKKTEIKRKFDEIVSFSEIGKFIDTPVKRYSIGMYLRLAFSLAAHLDPEIMLIDEVMAVGDIQFQQKCIRKISEIAKEGRTVLVVSHNMRVIETLTERCIYLKEGSIESVGSSLKIIKDYQKESLTQTIADDLPFESDINIKTPQVLINNISLTSDNSVGETKIFEPERLLRLCFEIEAKNNFPQSVVCVRFYRDRMAIFGNNSENAIGHMPLMTGKKRRIKIEFEALWLTPGNYTIVIFVLPSYFSPASDSLSKFYTKELILQGSRKYGGGYVFMRHNWSIE